MLFISHRGNISKIEKNEENNPDKILYCIASGYNVEVDVWYINNFFYLGHDEPQYLINEEFLLNKNLWCHAKNLKALENMLKLKNRCFWHENDKYTLTSDGYIWTFPGNELINKSIAVMPETSNYLKEELLNCYGICSDNIIYYKELLK